jgi:hypothetical protein
VITSSVAVRYTHFRDEARPMAFLYPGALFGIYLGGGRLGVEPLLLSYFRVGDHPLMTKEEGRIRWRARRGPAVLPAEFHSIFLSQIGLAGKLPRIAV